MAVSSLLAVGVLAAIGGLAFGTPLVIASSCVLAAQLIGLGSSTAARDLRALEVIGEGRGGLPHSAVPRLRRRLLDPVQRERLARSLDAARARQPRR